MSGKINYAQSKAILEARLTEAIKSGNKNQIKEAREALLKFEENTIHYNIEKSDDKPLTPEQQVKKEDAHQKELQEMAEAKALATAEATATTEAWTEDPVTQFVDEFGRTRDVRIAGQYTDDAPTAGVTASVAPPTGDIVQSYTDEFGRTREQKLQDQYDETPIPEAQPQDIAEHEQDAATYSYAPQKGESLADIVQAKYPNSDIKKALSEIKAANPDLKGGMFKAGQKINLPTLADGTKPDLDAHVIPTPRGRIAGKYDKTQTKVTQYVDEFGRTRDLKLQD